MTASIRGGIIYSICAFSRCNFVEEGQISREKARFLLPGYRRNNPTGNTRRLTTSPESAGANVPRGATDSHREVSEMVAHAGTAHPSTDKA